MNHDRTYRPVPYVPAPRLRDADGSMCQASRRSAGHAATHPVQPLKGLPETRATDVSYRASVPAGHGGRGVAPSYRALAPGGAGLPSGIEGRRSDAARPTANYSLLTAHSSYTFSAKEKDSETGLSYFGSRYYSSDLSVWLSVDPMSDKYPSLSPYTYCADNPVKLVDPNGNFPIIPFLIKAGINAMADCLMQAAMNYYFNPQTAGDLRASFLNINGWITLKSGAEGAIPWKIPGGKAGRAAVTAAGDVLAYFCVSPKQYTTKQALEDFTVGFIGELAGGGLSDLIAKYGAPAVAKGLCRIPRFSVNKIRGLTGYNLVSDYAQI